MNWTEDQLAEYRRRRGDTSMPPFMPPPNEAGHFALGRLQRGAMNKTEAAYDKHLWDLRHAGEVLWHKFEGIKLRLADSTFYTVDFPVLAKGGFLEMHEVKGFWQDDARVKIKVAASIYPFRFIAVTRKGGQWQRETF